MNNSLKLLFAIGPAILAGHTEGNSDLPENVATSSQIAFESFREAVYTDDLEKAQALLKGNMVNVEEARSLHLENARSLAIGSLATDTAIRLIALQILPEQEAFDTAIESEQYELAEYLSLYLNP